VRASHAVDFIRPARLADAAGGDAAAAAGQAGFVAAATIEIRLPAGGHDHRHPGGPFPDLSGHVIGLADAVHTGADVVGYAVPASALAARLSGAKPWTEVEPADCGTGNEDSDVAVAAVIRYLLAVNTGDYDAARALVTPAFAKRNLLGEKAWVKAYATTYDDDFGLVDAGVDGTKADVRLSFRSQQDPGYGPTGATNATCLRWELVYHLQYRGEGWQIDSAKTVDKPGWKRC